MKRLVIPFFLLVSFIAGCVLLIQISPTQPPAYESFLPYPEARDIKPFKLVDNEGNDYANEQLKGQWNLLFLGYTFCPDICPTTLAELRRIHPRLIEQTDIKVTFVSVDPLRDTTERLNTYIRFFNDEFVAVTGEHNVLFPMTRNLGMMYSIPTKEESAKDYLVNHSGSVIVINPEGRLVGRFPPKFTPGQISIPNGELILNDMELLLEQ